MICVALSHKLSGARYRLAAMPMFIGRCRSDSSHRRHQPMPKLDQCVSKARGSARCSSLVSGFELVRPSSPRARLD